jgi:HEAT repeat protein
MLPGRTLPGQNELTPLPRVARRALPIDVLTSLYSAVPALSWWCMDYSVTFARHFARLVWLLLHESGNVDEQKAALRAVVTVSKDGPVSFTLEDWRLVVNGTPMPEVLTGVPDLAAQMVGHAVTELHLSQGALPGDVLGAARLLAGQPMPGQGGRAFAAGLDALEPRSIRAVIEKGANAEEPQQASPAGSTTPPAAAGGSAAAAPKSKGSKTGSGAPRRTSGATPAPLPPAAPQPKRELLTTDSTEGYLAFSAAPQPKGSTTELLVRLDATKSVNVLTRLLDEFVTLAENASREGKGDELADALLALLKRESALADADQKRAYTMALRRLNKPGLLRMVAALLPRRREKASEYSTVLARMGEDGADALIEQLSAAQSLSERRIYFDALVPLKAAVPALIHMLSDARWYVTRNAADLLGEMQAADADAPLAELLRHDDERVRRAAASALAKVATTKAFSGLRMALRDSSPQVRLLAAAGLAGRKGNKSAHTLTRALDEEEDGEVQMQIIATLGRIATPDAVQRLIKLAEPAGGLFKKKSAEQRIAAVEALGEARTPAALKALQELREDKDREVRDAAFRASVAAAHGSGAA